MEGHLSLFIEGENVYIMQVSQAGRNGRPGFVQLNRSTFQPFSNSLVCSSGCGVLRVCVIFKEISKYSAACL